MMSDEYCSSRVIHVEFRRIHHSAFIIYHFSVVSPDTRQHRGAHPADSRLFGAEQVPALRAATAELSWLLSRGYATKAALKTVGDRHCLRERQRLAVARAACADAQEARRRASRLEAHELAGERLAVDGFNLVITVEAALSRGVLVRCRDGCLRDLSSVHGSYRSVRETEEAIQLVGRALAGLRPASALWLLDRPVSNSGRLAARIREAAGERGWPWEVEVVFNPDAEIAAGDRVAVTSDSIVLDAARRWVNLNDHLVREFLPEAWVVDLGGPP